jgi:hypothetical protein
MQRSEKPQNLTQIRLAATLLENGLDLQGIFNKII